MKALFSGRLSHYFFVLVSPSCRPTSLPPITSVTRGDLIVTSCFLRPRGTHFEVIASHRIEYGVLAEDLKYLISWILRTNNQTVLEHQRAPTRLSTLNRI